MTRKHFKMTGNSDSSYTYSCLHWQGRQRARRESGPTRERSSGSPCSHLQLNCSPLKSLRQPEIKKPYLLCLLDASAPPTLLPLQDYFQHLRSRIPGDTNFASPPFQLLRPQIWKMSSLSLPFYFISKSSNYITNPITPHSIYCHHSFLKINILFIYFQREGK